jgi:hypothetical protein
MVGSNGHDGHALRARNEHTQNNPYQESDNGREMSERSSPILRRYCNCPKHQITGDVPSECFCENETRRVAIATNKGKPQREPCVSLSNAGSHSSPLALE